MGETVLDNPIIAEPNISLTGQYQIGVMSALLKPGQLYTIVTSTWAPEATGNYTWAVFSPSGEFLLEPGAEMEALPHIDGQVAMDLVCGDMDDILNNEESLPITGMPEIDGCGYDTFEFSDAVISNETCSDAVIERTFTAHDVHGNSLECTQQITIQKLDLEDAEAPLTAQS